MPTDKFILACGECKAHNYVFAKNRKSNPDKLKIKKFCRPCGKHTEHTETRLRK
jgi:large subunit ribosomal protein L33